MLCRSVPFWIWQLLRHVFYLHAARADKQIKMQAQTRTRPAGVMYRVQLTQGWEAWRSHPCVNCTRYITPAEGFSPFAWSVILQVLSNSSHLLDTMACPRLAKPCFVSSASNCSVSLHSLLLFCTVIRETAIFGAPELFLIRPTPRPAVPDLFLPWTVLPIHVPCHSARPSSISSSCPSHRPLPEMLEPLSAVLAVVIALFVRWMLMALAKAVKKLAECPFEMATLVKELPMLLLWMDWAFGRTLGSTVSRSCRLRDLSF